MTLKGDRGQGSGDRMNESEAANSEVANKGSYSSISLRCYVTMSLYRFSPFTIGYVAIG